MFHNIFSPQETITAELAKVRISSHGQMVPVEATFNDTERQYAWEQGQIDYLGIDKFDNIKKALDAAIQGPAPSAKEQQKKFSS